MERAPEMSTIFESQRLQCNPFKIASRDIYDQIDMTILAEFRFWWLILPGVFSTSDLKSFNSAVVHYLSNLGPFSLGLILT